MSKSSLSHPSIGKKIGRLVPSPITNDLSTVISYDPINDLYFSVTLTGIDYKSLASNENVTWRFFDSHAEYREYVAAYFHKKAAAEEEKRLAEIANSEAIIAEVAENNTDVFRSFGEDEIPSTFRLVARGKPIRKDPYEGAFLRVLMMSANKPSQALDFAKSLVAEGQAFSHCFDSHHLWNDPRYIMVEWIGSSRRDELRVLSAEIDTRTG